MTSKNNTRIHQCNFYTQEVTVQCRKSLMVAFDNNESGAMEIIVVIGLNPSKADDFNSDHTISVLKNHFRKKCRKLIIYNLFQNYSTNPSGIIEQTATDFSEDIIQKSLQEADEIVIVWGDETKYTGAKQKAMQQLNMYKDKLRMFQNPKTGRSPCHPRNGLGKLSYIKYSSNICDCSHTI